MKIELLILIGLCSMSLAVKVSSGDHSHIDKLQTRKSKVILSPNYWSDLKKRLKHSQSQSKKRGIGNLWGLLGSDDKKDKPENE